MHYGIFLGNSLDDKEAIILDFVCLTQVKFMPDWNLAVVVSTSLPFYATCYVCVPCPAGFIRPCYWWVEKLFHATLQKYTK